MGLAKEETLKQKKKREKDEEVASNMWFEDVRQVCKTPNGRRLVWNILAQCKFIQNVGDIRREITERNIGRQNVGHWLLAQILEADENIFFKMMTESKQGDYNVRK